MKSLLLIILIAFTFQSCDFFKSKEKIAIEICQNAKVQSPKDYELDDNASWLDFANVIAKHSPNSVFKWKGTKTKENNLYIVSFVDTTNWGFRWEVDINQKIVKSINQNEYLARKYGLSRFNGNNEFEIVKIEQKGLEFDYKYSNSKPEIIYIFKATVLNKTDKIISKADIGGSLRLIFKEKTIAAEEHYVSGFSSPISETNPWSPKTNKEFYIKTKGIDNIYFSYEPDYIFFVVSLIASDPVGYNFNKDIADIDLKAEWKSFKENKKNVFSSDNAKNKEIEKGNQVFADSIARAERLARP